MTQRSAEEVGRSESELLADLWAAEQAAFQKMMGLSDWLYKDLPRLSHEHFDQFVEIAGAGNLRWITMAKYPARNGGPPSKRGQVMISPQGQANFKAFAEADRATPPAEDEQP